MWMDQRILVAEESISVNAGVPQNFGDSQDVSGAAASFEWQNDFAIAATAVEDNFPASFAAVEIVGDELVIRAHRAIGQRADVVGGRAINFDRLAGRVRAVAQSTRSIFTNDMRSKTEVDVVSGLPADRRSVVDRTLVPDVVATDEARYGEGRLEVGGSSNLACTGGFNVRNIDALGVTVKTS